MQDNKLINQHNYNANGERHGIWEVYYDNGQLGFKCIYENGNLIGLWEWYDKGGLNKNIKFYAR